MLWKDFDFVGWNILRKNGLAFCDAKLSQVFEVFILQDKETLSVRVTSHERHGGYFLNGLFKLTAKRTQKIRITGQLWVMIDWWITITNGQLRWKRFHAMTSSCLQCLHLLLITWFTRSNQGPSSKIKIIDNEQSKCQVLVWSKFIIA